MDFVQPMLATPGGVPVGGAWSAEVKWDGIRLITAVGAAGELRCWTRAGNDVTGSWPAMTAHLPAALEGRSAVLDGEIIGLGADGKPSFGQLQQRHLRPVTVVYMVFDLLALDGEDLTSLPWHARRARLEALDPTSASWQAPAAHPDPEALFAFTREQGLEGVVCKRRDSRYLPGIRSPDWVKVKHVRTQEVVLGGWLPGQGRLAGGLGALLLGIPAVDLAAGEPAGLRYVGRVGTGFTVAARRELLTRLRELASPRSPFRDIPRLDARDATWTEPALVGEVTFTEWTGNGRLRHPAWRGLRTDKAPDEVRVET